MTCTTFLMTVNWEHKKVPIILRILKSILCSPETGTRETSRLSFVFIMYASFLLKGYSRRINISVRKASEFARCGDGTLGMKHSVPWL